MAQTLTLANLEKVIEKSSTSLKEWVETKIPNTSAFSITWVDTLPTENISTSTIYMLKNAESTEENNIYDEYVYNETSGWETIGSLKADSIDLSNYYNKTETYNKTEVDNLLKNIDVIIDPLEYINKTHGIEDTPVGSTIEYIGETPKHYLPCDGAEYNIADYPYLTEYIKNTYGNINYFGGDGEYTFSTPFTEKSLVPINPSSENIICSSYLSKEQRTPECLFDGKNNSFWLSDTTDEINKQYVGYIFDTQKIITSYSISVREYNSNDIVIAPRKWKLQGSNDGIIWNDLDVRSDISFDFGETKIFNTSTRTLYYQYRLFFEENNGYKNPYAVSIGELSFMGCDAITNQIIKAEPTYFMQNFYIGDTPVGYIMNYVGETPENYLPCDGNKYNIADYKELAEYIKTAYGSYNYFGGDGVITFAVPIFDTAIQIEKELIYSNYESGFPATNAIDNVLSTFWHTNPNCYIGYGYSDLVYIKSYSITNRNYNDKDIKYSPSSVSFQISENNTEWETIENHELTWTEKNETKTFVLNETVACKYCRLYFTGTERVSLAEFTIEDEQKINITHFIKCKSIYSTNGSITVGSSNEPYKEEDVINAINELWQ